MINFKNLEVTFKQQRDMVYAVKNATMTIREGEIFGIVGSSGAGKSTLLRTINLLERPTKGEIIVDGEVINHFKGDKLRDLRRNIGMIFQHFNLVESKTVYENIAFGMKAAGKDKNEIDRRVKELLELVGLTDKIDSYPSKLSGGQKQRVGIARALANDAKILLCDEPTSALDLETTASILALLKDLNQKLGITMVLITHEMDVVKSICDRVAVMNRGEIVEMGEVFDIFTSPVDDFTKQLISYTSKFEIPDEFLKNLENPILKITFRGDAAMEPVLSEVTKRYEVQFNILHGKIEYINGVPLGILFVALKGSSLELNHAIAYLKSNTTRVEEVPNG